MAMSLFIFLFFFFSFGLTTQGKSTGKYHMTVTMSHVTGPSVTSHDEVT